MSSLSVLETTKVNDDEMLDEYLDDILSTRSSGCSYESTDFLVEPILNEDIYLVNTNHSNPTEELLSNENSFVVSRCSSLHENDEIQTTKRSKKRNRNESSWKRNKIRKLREEGKAHFSEKNKFVPAKKMKSTKNCVDNCSYQCKLITEEEREQIFSSYYSVDASLKRSFLLSVTERDVVKTRRLGRTTENSRKQFSFKYFFEVRCNRFRVCKDFFLGTLDISQQKIYQVHRLKNEVSGVLPSSKQGKHKKKYIPSNIKDAIREHILKFPTVDSHYCRRDSNKKYLHSELNVAVMYEMFKQEATQEEEKRIKICTYRNIFNNEFNLSFFKPKKDRCDLCEEFKVMEMSKNSSEELKKKYENHMSHKQSTRDQRQNDRESSIPVLCFDLQNVLSCPKAEVSSFFYHSKLNTYNLTGHLSTNNKVYCALWNESLMGRSGNDLACALIKILEKVLTENCHFTEIILWADSCVPQNRNSIMTFALLNFIHSQENVRKITLRFSVPGHSCIQEIDAVHSVIERQLSKREYYSPISLMRILLNISYKKSKLVMMQMIPGDFKNFQECSKFFNFKAIPFSKVCELELTSNFLLVGYKTEFFQDYEYVTLRYDKLPRKANNNKKFSSEMPIPKEVSIKSKLPESKIKSFKAMLPFMPQVDSDFFKILINNNIQ